MEMRKVPTCEHGAELEQERVSLLQLVPNHRPQSPAADPLPLE